MAFLGAFVMPHPPIAIPKIGQNNIKTMHATIRGMQTIATQIATLKPDTIVIASPHARGAVDALTLYTNDTMVGDFNTFGFSNISITYLGDIDLARHLKTALNDAGLQTITKQDEPLDHGVSVPLYYVLEAGVTCRIVVIAPGGFDALKHYEYGAVIGDVLKRVSGSYVFIASGDLSHKLMASGPYGYDPKGSVFDEHVTQALKKGDFESLLAIDPTTVTRAAQCGYHSIALLGGAIKDTHTTPFLHSYEGPFGVGYATASFLRKDDIDA